MADTRRNGHRNPPQTQDRQPGLESEMTPRPDFAPRYPGSGRLKGRVAVISGGDSGIGRAIAVLFAREGARIAVLYKDEHDDARETERLIGDEGGEALLLPGDLQDPATATASIDAVVAAFGGVNILVNNAGEQHQRKKPEDIPADQIVRTFATNIFAPFLLVQKALPHMQTGDCIINITSVTAFRGSDELIDYSASKGALLSFTRALARNLVERGIRVNAVAPGPIWTPLIPASFDADRVAAHGSNTPMKRAGQPNEVAPCALFLACDDASYMTGQTLNPNGGDPMI